MLDIINWSFLRYRKYESSSVNSEKNQKEKIKLLQKNDRLTPAMAKAREQWDNIFD